LKQHIRDSSGHADAHRCEPCDLDFNSDQALQAHMRDAPAHQPAPETPLDAFFMSFSSFHYEPSMSPAKSWKRLSAYQGWEKGSSARNKAWDAYQNALEEECKMWYGPEDDIASWHTLCRAVGIDPPPMTGEECQEVSVIPWDE
jgi:hypothetical protein